jgi:WD repeat-containing protein mio
MRSCLNFCLTLRIEPAINTTFNTKCINNLTVDYADQNYFASSALDQPGIMIWDRRAVNRPLASPFYNQAVDEDDLPYGGALRLDQLIEMDQSDNKHSFIRSIRYCRDHRGLLGVLSRTGQLKILKTNKEFPPVEMDVEGSPELLQVYRSHEMDVHFADPNRKQDQIVSFDWVTLGSSVLRPRVLVLRASGAFEILEQPPYTADHLFKLVPWKSPHRGLEGGCSFGFGLSLQLTGCQRDVDIKA